jgi:pimeloyl-ACP methyl ester carboxylesterase
MDKLGLATAAVVGHDWGGGVAWWLAANAPARLERLVILNCPHLGVMAREVWRPQQLWRSAYMLLFQVPALAEWVCRRDNFWFLRAALGTARAGTFTAADVARYVEAWSKPGRLRGMLNWYRAALCGIRDLRAVGRVGVPALILWGDQDAFLGTQLAAPSAAMCDDGRLVMVEGATHWVQHEEPARVADLIDRFLRGLAVAQAPQEATAS